MSGEQVLLSSLSLRTVCGFPRPHQFQLNTTKEEVDDGRENPRRNFSRKCRQEVVAAELSGMQRVFVIGLVALGTHGESHV